MQTRYEGVTAQGDPACVWEPPDEATSPAGWRAPEALVEQQATRYVYEFRSLQEREDQTWRDWLHDDKTFHACKTIDEALTAARAVLDEDCQGREDLGQGPTTVTKWLRHPEGEETPYGDGGVWYETSDGEEGRVLIHKVLL